MKSLIKKIIRRNCPLAILLANEMQERLKTFK